ncbi:MAG TPA: nuclear transport factor 2 family protein [Candidatus Eisenbacteria bacterium]|nr:nuclear transport factor 2 family protein [Candidatus Eisenbacteria bacterium]
MSTSRPWNAVLPLVVLLATAAPLSGAPEPSEEVRHFVEGFLNAMNQLDMSALADMWAPGSATTLVRGGTITYGYDAIQAQAKRSLQGLAFRDSFEVSAEDVKVTMIGAQNAYVVTPMTLFVPSATGPPERRGGTITLVVEKRGPKWLILHDHTAVNCKQ